MRYRRKKIIDGVRVFGYGAEDRHASLGDKRKKKEEESKGVGGRGEREKETWRE